MEKRRLRETIRLPIADHHALIIEGFAATIGPQDNMTALAEAVNSNTSTDADKISG